MMQTVDNGSCIASPRFATALGESMGLLPMRLQTVTSLGPRVARVLAYLQEVLRFGSKCRPNLPVPLSAVLIHFHRRTAGIGEEDQRRCRVADLVK
jgi:hypothetical protein